MAVIGRIRKRVGLLIAFVGISMLLFILGDLVTSNKGIMHNNSDVIGLIGGEKVHYAEFEKRVETLTDNYKMNSKSDNVDANTMDMLREQAWGMFLNENTLGEEYKKLGLACSDKELFEMVTGKDPHPQVKQAFTDPKTGQFDPGSVIRFLKDLPNRDAKLQAQWKNFEDAIRDERIAQKYKELIKGGIFVNDLEAKQNYADAQRKASIHYVRLDYNTIPDSLAKVTDDDLTAAYNANKNKYRQQETMRKIEYVTFDVTASPDDKNAVMQWLVRKQGEFASATNDTVFVNQNSDNPFDSTFHAKGTMQPVVDTTLFNAKVGTMTQIYIEGDFMKISKLVAERSVPDSVKARHILVKIENNDTLRARTLVDSIKTAIKKGAKFSDLATKFSADPGSAAKGGDLGWFRPGVMVKEFNDFCFQGKKGDMNIVETQFGFHLIEIMDQGKPSRQIQVGTLDRKVEPSQKTFDAAFNKANQFAANNTTGEAFDSSVIKMGLNKRIADNIKENDRNIAGLDQPRELIKWAYSAKKGDVSKVYTLGDKFVMAHLVDIKEKGILPLESVKDQVTIEAKKDVKAKMLIEKINATGVKTVDAVAQKLNTTASDADNILFQNAYIQNIGGESALVGHIFAMKAGQTSPPVKGESGVIMFSVKSFTEPPSVKDNSATIKAMMDQRRSRSEYETFSALKEKANVEDNRGKFY